MIDVKFFCCVFVMGGSGDFGGVICCVLVDVGYYVIVYVNCGFDCVEVVVVVICDVGG